MARDGIFTIALPARFSRLYRGDVFRKLGLICAALAFFSLAGGHWSVLQLVAWSEMLRDYAQSSGSLRTAVEQTFDGQHRCALCRAIQAGKANERQGAPAIPGLKEDVQLKALLTEDHVLPGSRPADKLAYPLAASSRSVRRDEAPPTPPPRQPASAA